MVVLCVFGARQAFGERDRGWAAHKRATQGRLQPPATPSHMHSAGMPRSPISAADAALSPPLLTRRSCAAPLAAPSSSICLMATATASVGTWAPRAAASLG
jgi:hypothetical protein